MAMGFIPDPSPMTNAAKRSARKAFIFAQAIKTMSTMTETAERRRSWVISGFTIDKVTER
jgi:hypothetical protein